MLAFISDVHIRRVDDENAKLFLQFLNHPLIAQAEKLYLLGDIFDLMVGSKKQYLKEFEPIFLKIKQIAISGKHLHFIEGNHDFHLRRLLENYFCESQFTHHTKPFVEEYQGEKFLVCHGDEIELENPSYERYRKIIKSNIIKNLANGIVPHRFIKSVGERASHTSRKYSANYENEQVRDKFVRSARKACQDYSVEKAIFGHSHLKEHIQEDNFEYINNGFFPSSKCFSIFNQGQFQSMDLEHD